MTDWRGMPKFISEKLAQELFANGQVYSQYCTEDGKLKSRLDDSGREFCFFPYHSCLNILGHLGNLLQSIGDFF